MPSTDFTGGYQTAVYQDPSEETHGKLKTVCFEVLKMARPRISPQFARAFDELNEVKKAFQKQGKVSFSDNVDNCYSIFCVRPII
ncbi:hypothetical protein SUGI_0762280 [Cryptomeria japonica]|nr:hypothetical protein SUGI_0762280 [Cryptomeria japonica]